MLAGSALNFANHVLRSASWARSRLKPFAGQTARLSLGPLAMPIEITQEGLFAAGERSATVAVSITLPATAPLRALSDRSALFAAAQIAGSAELAETLGFVFRNLRWDVEDDLSRLVGDIAARRLSLAGRHLAHAQLRGAKNLAVNVVEYLTEEKPAIARRADVASFCRMVDGVRDDCSALEKRLQRLESR